MPNRIIKESICYSEDIEKLTPFEEIVFYRLIVNCDDFGRFDGRPGYIKNMLFRIKESVTRKSIEDALQKLALIGLVKFYEVDGKSFLYLPKWDCHQQRRAKASKFPQPPTSETICNHMTSSDINGNHPQANVTVFENRESIHDIRESSIGADAPAPEEKHKRGQFGWVKLSDSEYQRIIGEFGEDTAQHYIAYVDESAQQTGNKNKWKDWNLTVRKAIKNQWGGSSNGTNQRNTSQLPAGNTGTAKPKYGNVL